MTDYDINFRIALNKGFYKLYPFTSENISGYIDEFDLNNKSLLTVGSSCDQVINASLKDCKDITILDICPDTEYYFYLKLACLYELSLDEYFSFLCSTDYPKYYKRNNNLFNMDTYNKIKNTLKSLNIKAFEYWNEIFETIKPNDILKTLFVNDVNDAHIIKKSNLYLSNDILYDETKKKIKNTKTNFIVGDIENMNIGDNYDNIWLSNIADYISLNKFVKIIDSMVNSLNINGKLLICYLYKVNLINTGFHIPSRDIYDTEELMKILKNHDIDVYPLLFDGISYDNYNTEKKKDAILVYKNTR